MLFTNKQEITTRKTKRWLCWGGAGVNRKTHAFKTILTKVCVCWRVIECWNANWIENRRWKRTSLISKHTYLNSYRWKSNETFGELIIVLLDVTKLGFYNYYELFKSYGGSYFHIYKAYSLKPYLILAFA